MIQGTRRTRQPVREVWSKARLVHEWAIALGNAIDRSTLSNYSSTLNIYLSFVKLHDLPVEPTPETLSFFQYICATISARAQSTPTSLAYRSNLKPTFPQLRKLAIRHLFAGHSKAA